MKEVLTQDHTVQRSKAGIGCVAFERRGPKLPPSPHLGFSNLKSQFRCWSVPLGLETDFKIEKVVTQLSPSRRWLVTRQSPGVTRGSKMTSGPLNIRRRPPLQWSFFSLPSLSPRYGQVWVLKVLNQNCSLKNSLFCILNLWGGGGGITSLDLSSKNTFFGRLLEYVFLLLLHK